MVSWRTWVVMLLVLAAVMLLFYGSPDQFDKGLLAGISIGSLLQVIISGLRSVERQAARKRERRSTYQYPTNKQYGPLAPYEVEPPE